MKKLILFAVLLFLSSNGFAQVNVPAYVDTAGLLSWWPFTGNAIDSSGHGNNGIVTGAVLSTDRFGNANHAYYYNGASYILTSTTTNAPLGSHARSLSCWINTNYSTMTGYGQIGFGWGSNSYHGARFQFSIYHDMPYFVGEYADMWGTINVTDSLWHNIIITYDGDSVKMYVDGIFDIGSNQTLNTSGEQYKFGDIVDSHDDYFTGLLDDAGVWNRVLTKCEIAKLYLSMNTLITTQPLNDSLTTGSAAVFTITDTGGTATYQWQENTGSGFINLAGGTPYFGVTTKSLTVNPVTATMNGYKFRCVRTSTYSCIDTSDNALIVITNIHTPHFTSGHLSSFTVCEDTSARSINSFLAVIDTTVGTLTWSVVTPPLHGTAVASYTASSAGSAVTPTGLTYTPATGYSGTNSFVVRVTDGSGSDTTKVRVTVAPLPTVSAIVGPDTVCFPAELAATYTDATAGGIWSTTNTLLATVISTSTGGLLSAISGGLDTINYTVTNTCGTAIASKVIYLLPYPVVSPIAGPSFVCIGGTITLTDTVTGGVWVAGNSHTVITSGGVVAGLTPGMDTISYSISNFCGSSSITKTVLVYTVHECDSALVVAQPGYEENTLKIYPNPSNSLVTIAFEKNTPIGSIQLTNQLGQVILDKDIEANSAQLDFTTFAKGMYFLRVYCNNQYFYNKILKD